MSGARTVWRTLAVLLLAACSTTPAGTGPGSAGTAAAPKHPVFELRLASARLEPGWTEMPVRGGGSLIVAPNAILLPEQVSNAAISKGDSPALLLNVKPAYRQSLGTATGEHLYDEKKAPHKNIVFLIDGQVVYPALLGMPLSRQVSIRIGTGAITEDEARRCADEVKRLGGGG